MALAPVVTECHHHGMPERPLRYVGPGKPPVASTTKGSSSARGYGHRWRKASQAFLRAHPRCALCPRPASQVDHVRPHKGDMRLFWDRTNWQGLCASCHGSKSNRQ